MQGRLLALSAVALVGFFATDKPAQAEYIVNLTQQGGGVVANGSGTIDLTDLMLAGHAIGEVASMVPNVGIILTGPTVGTAVDSYGFFTGPTSFGSGTGAVAPSGSGDLVGILADVEQTLFLPSGYVSGTPPLGHLDLCRPDLCDPRRDPWHLHMDLGHWQRRGQRCAEHRCAGAEFGARAARRAGGADGFRLVTAIKGSQPLVWHISLRLHEGME